MANRKAISKTTRQKVYAKYNGHCAYCGKEISYKQMQVDHFIPAFKVELGYDAETLESESNLMPTCWRCNHYKRGETLEHFRKNIEQIPCKLNARQYIFKVGVDYGFFSPEPRKVEFYFEKIKKGGEHDERLD